MKNIKHLALAGVLSLLAAGPIQAQVQAFNCQTSSDDNVITGEVFFNYGSLTNAYALKNRSSLTVSEPIIGEMQSADFTTGLGFWSKYLLTPAAPIVRASEGDLPNRIRVSWVIDPLSPVPNLGFKIYRNGDFLANVDNTTFDFVDFNVIAGENYTYIVYGINDFGPGFGGSALGFVNPNGVITGLVKTFSNNPVPGVAVTLTPTLGTALDFNGMASAFTEYQPNYPRAQFSLSAWVKLGAGNDAAGILDLGSSISKNWWMHTTPAASGKGVTVGVGNGTGDVHELSQAFPAGTEDDWHYVAATYNGASLLFYLDGELISTAVAAISADSMPLFFGKRSDGSGFFNGKLDEVRIFDKQLSQTELQMLMNKTAGSTTAGLFSYWKFDEGTGSKSFNISANKITAYLCGAAWVSDKPDVLNAGITDVTGFYRIEGINYGPGKTFTAQAEKRFYFNQSLEFNGVNAQRAELTDFDLADSSTIEITVKAFDFAGNQCLLSKQDGGTTHFALNLNAGNLVVEMGGASHNFGALGMGFHRLSFVIEQLGSSTTVTYYKDGTLVGSHPFSGVASSFAGGMPWTLGAKRTSGVLGNYFSGLIDDAAFYNTLISLPDIQTAVSLGTNTTHVHLQNYFSLNEGSGTELVDYGLGLTGKGTIYGAAWSTVTAILQSNPHDFTPSTRLVTLNPSNTSADGIDFTDQSTIPVTGYVRFDGTTCFQKGVEILVNGSSHVPQIFTDATGKFSVDFEPGVTVKLTPKFEQHTFYPAFWDLKNISSPVAGILFRNQTKRKVYGQLAGNATCRKSVVPDGAIVKVKVATLNGCYEQVKQLPENGQFVFDGVPPDSVTVALIEHSNPVIYTFFQNLGGKTLDLKLANDTTDFIYLAPPQVELSPLPTNSCGNAMLEMTEPTQVIVKVFEEYDGGVCYLDSADLTINNGLADKPQFDTLMTGGQFKYKFKAGSPQIAAPHLKFLQVTAKAHDELATESLSAVVLGRRARQTTFASTSPQLPTLILRDPPGDGSSAYIEKGATTCQTWSYTAAFGSNLDVKAGLSLGADLTTSVGLGAEVELEIDATLDIGIETNTKYNNLTTNAAETCLTTTERIATSENDAVVGSEGGADVYMGGAINYIFGITDELKFDSVHCAFVLDKGLVVFPDGFATTFVYSEYQIKTVVIPNLIAIGDPVSAQRWQDIIDLNTKLKNEAVFSRNLSFDAGVVYEQSENTEASKTITHEWTVEFDAQFITEFGLEVNGIGLSAGLQMGFTTTQSGSSGTTTTDSRTVGFTLADDDLRDNFTVNIKKDKAYGTPVFQTVSGQSACPWEPNTQNREEVQLTIDRNVAVNVPENDVAIFQVNIGNTSPSGETGFYFIELVPESNPNGATLAANGVDLSGPVLYQIPPNGSLPLTVTIGKGPVEYDYTGLRIAARSGCEFDGALQIGIPREEIDPKFYKEVVVDVHFLEPCSPVNVGFPLQDWVHLSTSGTFMNITLDSYDKTDPDLELIRVQYRRSQGDGAWINIAELPKNSLGAVFTIVPWDLPTSFKDGFYEIRAVTQCFSGALNPGISKVVKGKIERTPPEIFGIPEPADGVYSAGDEISIRFIEPIRCDQLIQADLFSNNNVGLYDTETGDLVDATISCSGDKIVIVPKVPNRFIENKVLRVQVNNIKDLANNHFVEKKWEFFVDRNPIRWEGGNVKVSKLKSEFVAVNRRILNDGGQATAFELLDIPAWVRVYPTSGVIQPGAAEDITFEFDSTLVFGNYLDTIRIDAPEGLEPLIVNCRVLCESPAEWKKFDPAAYPHTMNFSVKLNIEGQLSADEEDILAAFIDGELRGTAKVKHLPTLPPVGTQYMVFLNVYGDADDDGKPVKLEIWDASACLRYGQVLEQFDFEVDNVIGAVGNPTILHTNSQIRRDIALKAGWNWISFNLLQSNPNLNSALVSLKHPQNDLIKAQTSFAEYFGGNWLGSLPAINNSSMFQFRADQPDTIQMRGALIDPASLNIPIAAGWNWIGYVPNYALSVTEALSGLTPLNGDIIKGQTSFAQYIAGFGWLGSLQFMEPPHGYQLKISLPGTLTYPPQRPNKPAFGKPMAGKPSADDVQSSLVIVPRSPHWTVDATQFEHSMTLVGMLSAGGQNATLAGHELGVFAGGQLRGSAQALYIEPMQSYVFFLTLFANTSGEQLQFKLYDSTTGQVVDLVSPQARYFVADLHQGGIESTSSAQASAGGPVPFTLKTSGVGEVAAVQYLEVQPNPFDDATMILFACDQNQEVRLLISDATGRVVLSQKIAAVSGLNYFQWSAGTVSAGVYFVRLETDKGTSVRKVVKEE